MNRPKYHIAVFGNPVPPEKDLVESGFYHPDVKYTPCNTQPGDILLLYCTGSYSEHAMTVPGVGIVFENAGSGARGT